MKKTVLFLLSLSVLLFSSCSAMRTKKNLKPATVLESNTVVFKRDVSGGPGIMLGTQLGIIGSQVGCGVAAHIVGATVGAIAGGGLGYAAERNSATTRITTVQVRLDDGLKATIGVSKLKYPLRPGDRVWVRCSASGMPLSLVESAPATRR